MFDGASVRRKIGGVNSVFDGGLACPKTICSSTTAGHSAAQPQPNRPPRRPRSRNRKQKAEAEAEDENEDENEDEQKISTVIRSGRITIVGRSNAGKSALFNPR